MLKVEKELCNVQNAMDRNTEKGTRDGNKLAEGNFIKK